MFFRHSKPAVPKSAPSLPDLAGFFAAHAVWSVSDGETLVPLVGFNLPDGSTSMARFAADDLTVAVDQGRQWLANNPQRALQAAFIVDGFIPLPSGKTDALIVEAVEFDPSGSRQSAFTIALPYRPFNDPRSFAIHRPKFVGHEGPKPDLDTLFDAFFKGVKRHEKGAKVWADRLDESV
jgi:hypothetical protein